MFCSSLGILLSYMCFGEESLNFSYGNSTHMSFPLPVCLGGFGVTSFVTKS